MSESSAPTYDPSAPATPGYVAEPAPKKRSCCLMVVIAITVAFVLAMAGGVFVWMKMVPVEVRHGLKTSISLSGALEKLRPGETAIVPLAPAEGGRAYGYIIYLASSATKPEIEAAFGEESSVVRGMMGMRQSSQTELFVVVYADGPLGFPIAPATLKFGDAAEGERVLFWTPDEDGTIRLEFTKDASGQIHLTESARAAALKTPPFPPTMEFAGINESVLPEGPVEADPIPPADGEEESN